MDHPHLGVSSLLRVKEQCVFSHLRVVWTSPFRGFQSLKGMDLPI